MGWQGNETDRQYGNVAIRSEAVQPTDGGAMRQQQLGNRAESS